MQLPVNVFHGQRFFKLVYCFSKNMKKFICFIPLVLSLCAGCVSEEKRPYPKVATTAVPGDADDCAIWVNSANSSSSLVIGNDKRPYGGLFVWDMNGRLVYRTRTLSRPNGVDIRCAIDFYGEKIDVVVCGIRSTNEIKIFQIEPKKRILIDITSGEKIFTGYSADTYGLRLYKRRTDGKLFAFATCKAKDDIHQIAFEEDGQGGLKGRFIRAFGGKDMQSFVEGMCADDEAGYLYCSDERQGILKYEADPDKNNDGLIHKFAIEDGIKGDREGIGLYEMPGNAGYLVLSSQGNSSFKIYKREGNNDFVKTVYPRGVTRTDGIAVTSKAILPLFPKGVVVCHNDEGCNFVLFDWGEFFSAN